MRRPVSRKPAVLIILSALAACVAVVAAPRTPPAPGFDSHEAAGRNGIFSKEDGEDYVDAELTVLYVVRGPAGATYTAELWVEGNSTGENAVLVDSRKVILTVSAGSNEGRAREKVVKYQLDKHRPLPWTDPGAGWTYGLVLKDEKGTVAQTGFHHAHYDWKPREELRPKSRLGK